MKKLVLSLCLVAAVAMVACSKDKKNDNGNYATTPGATNCASGAFPGVNYYQPGVQNYGYNQGYYPQQAYGQYPQQNVNCIPQNSIYGGNPYYFQANSQMFLGTCDLRFLGRGQLCPTGYQCRSYGGYLGICMRGY